MKDAVNVRVGIMPQNRRLSPEYESAKVWLEMVREKLKKRESVADVAQ